MKIALLAVCLFLVCCQTVSGWWWRPKPPKTCTTAKECGWGYCCRIQSMLKGRRKRQATLPVTTGECLPLGSVGQRCYVGGPDVAPPPGLSFDFCPCQPWLTCVSSGVRTVPLGEEGTCQWSFGGWISNRSDDS